MSWKDDYFRALDTAKLFENSGHRTRFKELMDCYAGYPFFTKGLCKCIYLSAWDEEHFMVMLETLTDMSLGRERGTGEMLIKGDLLADEAAAGEAYMYRLSSAFLAEQPFQPPEGITLSPDYQYLADQALKASAVIDAVEESRSDT